MTDGELGLATIESPEGAPIFIPSSGGISIVLTPEEVTTITEEAIPSAGVGEKVLYQPVSNLYPTTPKTSAAPSPNVKGKVVCFDTETTGVTPLDSRLVVCSFWDLSKGPETMETFSGWDEELLIQQVAAYLNRERPETLVAYNMGFDLNFLLTRMMAFGVSCPPMRKMKNYDLMTVLGQGGESYAKVISKVGTAEDWLQYFYGETKPFTIDELMEGYKKGDLVPAIVRNHSCVYAEGRMYLLIQEVYGGPQEFIEQIVPTAVRASGAGVIGPASVTCPVCLTKNICLGVGVSQKCIVCRTDLTDACTKA